MDVDLSTGLEALLPLVAPLVSGHSDLAIGTRLAPGSRVVRGPKRELISRSYNRLLHLALRTRFSDAQCGFKAGRREAVAGAPARGRGRGLVLRHRAAGPRRAPRPAHPRGPGRLGRRPRLARRDRHAPPATTCSGAPPLRRADALRPGRVGSAPPLYLLLFLALRARCRRRPRTPSRWPSARSPTPPPTAASPSADAAARGFGHHFKGLLVFVLCLALTSGSLALLGALAPGAPAAVELAALVAANLLATALRYGAMRLWVFGPASARAAAPGGAPERELQGLPAWRPRPDHRRSRG